MKRYIDDTVGAVSCRRAELEAFIDFFSNFHPALQFSSTITETELPFSGHQPTWVRGRRRLTFQTTTYTFPMTKFRPPSTTRKQIFKTTSISFLSILSFLRRLCSDDDDFLVHEIYGEQGWRSGESTRLPPMRPGFDSRTRRHMWVEFVVGSRPCSERFFSGYSGFPLSSKTNTSKFQFDLESVPNWCPALNTLKLK